MRVVSEAVLAPVRGLPVREPAWDARRLTIDGPAVASEKSQTERSYPRRTGVLQKGLMMDSSTRGLLVALVVLLVVALGFSALMGGMMGPGFMGSGPSGQGPMGPGMMPGHGWMWGFGMGLGGLVMLAFWGALIVGVVLLIRALGGAPGRRWHSTPIDILKRRYAAGEITREQYDEMRKDLER